MKKKVMSLLLCLTLAASLLTGCGGSKTEETKSSSAAQSEAAESQVESQTTESQTQESQLESQTESQTTESQASEAAESEELLSGKHHAELVIKDYGTIELELDADAAPITVTNFVKLAKEGFYDGLTFHRIISGFMIQGGDPNGNGTGGSDQTIKGEFSANGIENNISHKRGVISMARAQDPDSASSQFFIMHQDADYLDGNYAAFGEVTDGMDVVDEICDTVEVTDDNGTVADGQQPVIESLTIID